jgi:hypothetical protein
MKRGIRKGEKAEAETTRVRVERYNKDRLQKFTTDTKGREEIF